jgi:disulfide bond formation protein DsbB
MSKRLSATAAGAPFLAILAAWIATGLSLYFSDILGWIPCLLCWYQRICMYPLALILPIGVFNRDRKLPAYVLPLSVFGLFWSTYHVLEQKTDLFPKDTCSIRGGITCAVDYLNLFGWITIPMLAWVAFVIITVAMLIMRKSVLWQGNDEYETE